MAQVVFKTDVLPTSPDLLGKYVYSSSFSEKLKIVAIIHLSNNIFKIEIELNY